MAAFSLLSQITAYTALALWTFPVLPQILKNFRSQSTTGLSIYMYLLNIVSATLFAAFAIHVELPLPSILQPHVFVASCVVVATQIWRYEHRHSVLKTLGLTMLLVACIAALELAGFYLLHSASDPTVNLLYGILCCIVAFVGYVPQIRKTYLSKDASAISVLFLVLTIAGGCLFLVSLMFTALADHDAASFNWLAALTYVNVAGGAAVLAVQYLMYRQRKGDVESEWRHNTCLADELNDTMVEATVVEDDGISLYAAEKHG